MCVNTLLLLGWNWVEINKWNRSWNFKKNPPLLRPTNVAYPSVMKWWRFFHDQKYLCSGTSRVQTICSDRYQVGSMCIISRVYAARLKITTIAPTLHTWCLYMSATSTSFTGVQKRNTHRWQIAACYRMSQHDSLFWFRDRCNQSLLGSCHVTVNRNANTSDRLAFKSKGWMPLILLAFSTLLASWLTLTCYYAIAWNAKQVCWPISKA